MGSDSTLGNCMITAHTTTTKDGLAVAYLADDRGEFIAKMYSNREGTKIRIVIPELRTMRQTLIDDERHFVEFERLVK